MTNFSTLFTPVSVTIANAKEVSQNITINLVNSSEVSDLSAKAISTYTTVQSNSGNWQSTYNTFNSTSSTYLTAIPQNITINSISAISLSGTFYGDGSNLIGASLPGQAQINTTVVVNSANWNTAYINVSSQSLNIDSNVQFNQVSAGAIVTSSNSKLDLVGFGPNTAYLTTTPDDTTALFMGVFGADLRANNYVSIATNTGDVSRLWTFGADGSLSFPDGSTQTTAFTGNPEGGGATPIKRFDYVTVSNIDYSYSGSAAFGTLDTSPTWKLIRLTYANNGTISNSASAIDSWTGRLTATYV